MSEPSKEERQLVAYAMKVSLLSSREELANILAKPLGDSPGGKRLLNDKHVSMTDVARLRRILLA